MTSNQSKVPVAIEQMPSHDKISQKIENRLQTYMKKVSESSAFDSCSICVCTKHGTLPIDVWYDCGECLSDSFEFADKHGYSQCVSPHITRDGTDNGKWVLSNSDRWVEVSLKKNR